MSFVQDYFLKYYDYRPFKNVFLNKISGNSSKILGKIAQVVLPVWFKAFPGLPIYERQKQKVGLCPAIVCLTSFPIRIHVVWLVIECLLRQQLPPSLIVLYLSKKQFPNQSAINASFSCYVTAGVLQIRWVDEDIRSHKKYWYAVNDFANKDIITVDDDIMYQSDTISLLYESKMAYPYTIPSLYTHQIIRNKNGEVLPYSLWGGYSKCYNIAQVDAFFGSGGGTYFPNGSLQDANQPIEVINNICPLADDIWLNAIIRLNKYVVFPVCKRGVSSWGNKHNETLSSINNGQRRNDEQLSSVIRYFEGRWGYNPFMIDLKSDIEKFNANDNA